MKNLLKNKNVLVVLGLLIVSIAVLIYALSMNSKPEVLPELSVPKPETTPETAEALPLGYLLVQRNGDGGWIPLSTGEDMVVSISDEEDPSIKNTLRISQHGFLMESSTCDNQDCVDQGEVTLENMDERVLMNMVICLPHQLTVELYSIDQLVELSIMQ